MNLPDLRAFHRRARRLARWTGSIAYRSIVVPLLDQKETEHALDLACRLAADRGARVVLVGPLVVERELPLNAHMDGRLTGLKKRLDCAAAVAASYGVGVRRAIVRTRPGSFGEEVARGLVAVYALGLTPIVFIIAGLIFACTAATYAEGTVRYPEAGGSSSFARHAFNEYVSFEAAWAQMLNYIATIAVSAFFVPHYLSIFWGPLRENPWDIVGGAVVVVLLVLLNIVGIREAARLNIFLAVLDFGTQLLLVVVGFALVFHPHLVFSANLHWGVAPTWRQFLLAIPIAMIAYTGIAPFSNLAEAARDPPRDIPRSITWVAGAVFAIYFTLPLIALSALPVHRAGGHYETLLGESPAKHGFPNDPALG